MVKLDTSGAFLEPFDAAVYDKEINNALNELEQLDETGWRTLPVRYGTDFSRGLKDMAKTVSDCSDVFVVAGIGGSYLGARAGLEFISSPYYNAISKDTPEIYFAGNNLSAEYMAQIIEIIGQRDFSVNIVSKSGSTIETAIAARFFKKLLISRYGDAYKKRLYVTTDKNGSLLADGAVREGLQLLEMPARVGGRYSVLSVAGLLPLAVSGADIDAVMAGAREEMETGLQTSCMYAYTRQALYRSGKSIELLGCFEPAFRCIGEWWKQLFGESEGKENLGIFPAYADYTADLHSIGQFIQEGPRTLMETLVTFENPRVKLNIPAGDGYNDKLAAIEGVDINEINREASEAVKKAHIDGAVPVIELLLPCMSEESFGALVYFFERSCAVSAILSGVNPFGQPGVEAYKKNLYAIL